MSKALARAAPLRPEIRLAQAISEFEMKLSTQQKAEIRDHTRVPDLDDIMRLTAEIDRASTAKASEQRRCYGPRVTKFLEGLHQFAGTADIVVGGVIQNRTASGVWAVVRFSLLALTKYSPYIEKLSKLLMEVSRNTPLLKEMSKLYLRSKRIQDGLFEYYIVVVQLCQELYNLSQTNTIGQLWTAFSEEPYQKQLENWSRVIQTEVSLETAKLAKEESKKSIAFRSFSQKHMELQRQQQKQELKQRVLDACSQHNYRTIWKQTRKLGNTTSFLKAAAYPDWIGAKSSCTLLYSGKLGSGKSVLLANLVSDLFLKNDAVSRVAYFFCRHDTADSLMPRTIIGCLARQILQHLPNMDALEKQIKESSYQFDLDELVQLMKISVTKPVYFVLDGIDDLTIAHKHEVLDAIHDLQQKTPLLLCISTRFPQDIINGNSDNILHASIPEVNADIESYVHSEIDHRLVAGTLIISDSKLVQEVKEKLTVSSQGMFLWVYLQIINLCSMVSDFEICEALDDLPEGISETYNRLLRGCDHAKAQHRQRLFELILVAYEPLRNEELLEALSVEPGVVDYDPSKLLNSIDGIIRSCRGLIIVDEEETTVRLAHFSTRQFLISSAYGDRIDEASAQRRMSEVILTYLNYSIFDSRIAIRKPQTFSSSAVPAAILMNAIPMASKFIRISQNSKLDHTLANAGRSEITSNIFKNYALNYWDKHLMAVDQNDSCLKMLDAAISIGRIDLSTVHDQLTPLQRAATSQNLGVAAIFLKHGVTENDKLAALRLATKFEHVEMTDMLIDSFEAHGVLLERSIDQGDHFLMESLCRKCTFEILNGTYPMLLNDTPLGYAMQRGSHPIARILLESQNVNPRARARSRREPFFHAIFVGDYRGIELLTEMISADRFSQDELWKAVMEAWYSTKEVLLADSSYWGMTTVLLERGYLDVRYQLSKPLDNVRVTGVHKPLSNLRLSGHVPDLSFPLAHAARFDMGGLMRVMLNFDRTIVNELGLTSEPTYTPYDYADSNEGRVLLADYGGRSWKDL